MAVHFLVGQTVRLNSLRRQTPETITSEKFNFFRHMGIVVKSASFSDVQAVDDEVQRQNVGFLEG